MDIEKFRAHIESLHTEALNTSASLANGDTPKDNLTREHWTAKSATYGAVLSLMDRYEQDSLAVFG